MRNQEIKNLTITDLKLWSENPRDPLKNEITDFEIIKNAIINKESKWNLNKLMKQIGEFYDYSELPIVVKIDSQYIVYDGNRRIGLIKYLQSEAKYNKAGAKLAHKNKHEFLDLKKIPCNVCTMNIALDNIERKHIDNGTWNELERDYFMNIHRGEEKSIFIKIDEACGIISNNYKLNKGYVKNEILTKSNLESIGIGLDCNNEISTIYDIEFTKILIDHIVEIISSKEITTRVNRGKLKEVLTNKNLNRPLQKFEESLKKYTLEYVYKSDSTSDGFASGGSASGGSASGGSASGGSASDGSASGGSASGGSASGGSASGGNRGSIKKKPTLKRKGLHPGIKVRIEEYFNLPATVYPNAKIAMSRVLFEIVLKYVIEYTKFNGRTTMDKCGYFQPVYRGKFADATLMKLKFTDLINVTVDKKHFQDFDLEKMHQVIHNYKTGGLVIDAENYNNSLIFLIEFLLQDEQDLLNSLDITKL